MPSELEDLVEFLHHGNTQVRQAAVEHLVGISNDASIFKKPQMVPVKDLTLLVRDYLPIARNAFTILINISDDSEVLEYLATNDGFVEELLRKITDTSDSTANEATMLLANLAKSDSMVRLVGRTRSKPKSISLSTNTLDQLMDCFVKGAGNAANPKADFDYLSYFFADISKHKTGREYFVTRQQYDQVVPITKLTVFTEHSSVVRRKGVASTIKNVAFETDHHPMLLRGDEDDSGGGGGANLLPYLLLPLAGNEEFTEEESSSMLPDLQLLPPDKERDSEHDILVTHLETLLLLTTSRVGRDRMRRVQVYPLIRECHLHVDHDDVREACDRLVQVLMRDEEGGEEEEKDEKDGNRERSENKEDKEDARENDDAEEDAEEDEDRQIEEIF